MKKAAKVKAARERASADKKWKRLDVAVKIDGEPVLRLSLDRTRLPEGPKSRGSNKAMTDNQRSLAGALAQVFMAGGQACAHFASQAHEDRRAPADAPPAGDAPPAEPNAN